MILSSSTTRTARWTCWGWWTSTWRCCCRSTSAWCYTRWWPLTWRWCCRSTATRWCTRWWTSTWRWSCRSISAWHRVGVHRFLSIRSHWSRWGTCSGTLCGRLLQSYYIPPSWSILIHPTFSLVSWFIPVFLSTLLIYFNASITLRNVIGRNTYVPSGGTKSRISHSTIPCIIRFFF